MQISKWVYSFRGILVSLPLVFAFACFYAETEDEAVTWPLGSFLFLFGFLLRVWAHQYCPYLKKDAKSLTTLGPYSLVRNPIYIGNAFMCLGVTVISELMWFVPFTLVWCAGIYSLAVRHEEERLLARYGEAYSNYMSQVPRWFPQIEGLKGYFYSPVVAEAQCLLILIPFVLKEVFEPWFEH